MTTTTITPAKASKNLAWVNALRGLAILGVVLSHTYFLAVPGKGFSSDPWPLLHPLLKLVAQNGTMGVQLFFVASAFTLFLSLDFRHQNERRPVLAFFLRRFFRIAPLYYAGIAYYALWHRYADNAPDSVGAIMANVFFMHGVRPILINQVVPGGWSISVEMMFYCLVPVLALRIKSINGAVWFILGSLFLNSGAQYILAKTGLLTAGKEAFLFWFLPNQLPVFGLGILLFFIYKGGETAQLQPSALLACAGTLLLSFTAGTTITPGLPALAPHFFFSVSFVFLALALSKQSYFLLVNPLTTFIGKISFSLYLVHIGVLYGAQRLNWINVLEPSSSSRAALNLGLRFALVVVVSSGISYITYRLIEEPFQKLGKRLIDKLAV